MSNSHMWNIIYMTNVYLLLNKPPVNSKIASQKCDMLHCLFGCERIWWRLFLKRVVHTHLISTFLFLVIYSNMTSVFRFANKWAIYRLGIFSLAHAPVHVTDVSIHVFPLESILHQVYPSQLCITLSILAGDFTPLILSYF